MEAIGVLLKTVIEWLVGIVPAALLRHHFTDQRLADLVEVDVRSTGPVTITNRTAMPELSIYLRATNFSPFDVTIEQCTVDVWLGQPLIKQISLGHPAKISPRTSNQLFLSQTLSENQIAFAMNFAKGSGPGRTVALYGTMTCRTRIRTFTKNFTFERHNEEADAALLLNVPQPAQ